MMVSFLCCPFFPRGVLDEIQNLIESVSEVFSSYSYLCQHAHIYMHIVEMERERWMICDLASFSTVFQSFSPSLSQSPVVRDLDLAL